MVPARRFNRIYGDEPLTLGDLVPNAPVLFAYDADDGHLHITPLGTGSAALRNIGIEQFEVPVLGVGGVLADTTMPPAALYGRRMYAVSGTPPNALGLSGDFYLDTDAGRWYEKTIANVWTLRYTDMGGGGTSYTDADVDARLLGLLQSQNPDALTRIGSSFNDRVLMWDDVSNELRSTRIGDIRTYVVGAGVAGWAHLNNTDAIPAEKLVNAPIEILQPDAMGITRLATVDDVGKVARVGNNLRIGTVEVLHPASVQAASYEILTVAHLANYRGTWYETGDVGDPQLLDKMFAYHPGRWYEYSPNGWAVILPPTGWQGRWATTAEATRHVTAVGDLVYIAERRPRDVARVISFTPEVAELDAYVWDTQTDVKYLLSLPELPDPNGQTAGLSVVVNTAQDGYELALVMSGGGGGGGDTFSFAVDAPVAVATIDASDILLFGDSAASFAPRQITVGNAANFFSPDVQRNGASLTHGTEAINFTGDFTVSNIAQVARIDLNINQHLMNLMNNAPEANPLAANDRVIMLDDSNAGVVSRGRMSHFRDYTTAQWAHPLDTTTPVPPEKLMPTWDSITGKLAPTWDEITGKDAARPSAAEVMAGYGDDPPALRDARCSGRHPHS